MDSALYQEYPQDNTSHSQEANSKQFEPEGAEWVSHGNNDGKKGILLSFLVNICNALEGFTLLGFCILKT